jgi:hypothetical protein
VNLSVLAAVLLLLTGASVQFMGLRSGAYGAGRAKRDRLRYGVPAVVFSACGVVLLLLSAT